MKICFYNLTAGFKTGGLETYCWEAGRALVALGHSVDIVGGGGGAPRNDQVRLVGLPYRPRDRFPNFGTRFRKLAERVSLLPRALPLLRAGGYDAIIVNKPYDFPALVRLRSAGFAGVTVFRSGGTDFFWGDRLCARAVDLWLSTSAFNAAQVEARYGRPVTVVPNGVDPERFAPNPARGELRHRFGIPEGIPLVISVGRLIGLKGLQLVVRALAQLPEVHYLVVGEGPERQKLAALAEQTGVAGRVHFAGAVKHAELPQYLTAADVFVQPSVGEEAFGISVVEAMSCGLPVLASDQGGLREVVVPGETGLLIPTGQLEAWEAALRDITRGGTGAALGAAGRNRVLERFTWARNAERLVELITSKRRT